MIHSFMEGSSTPVDLQQEKIYSKPLHHKMRAMVEREDNVLRNEARYRSQPDEGETYRSS